MAMRNIRKLGIPLNSVNRYFLLPKGVNTSERVGGRFQRFDSAKDASGCPRSSPTKMRLPTTFTRAAISSTRTSCACHGWWGPSNPGKFPVLTAYEVIHNSKYKGKERNKEGTMTVKQELSPPAGVRGIAVPLERSPDGLRPWIVSWSGVWVGTLAALATALILGLVAIAVGAHEVGHHGRIDKWADVRMTTLIFSVVGAFLSFVVGGWVAVKIGSIRYAETASLHGAIVWLVAVPLLLLLVALGAGGFFGGWYSGLAGSPSWVGSVSTAAPDPRAAIVARNSALGAVTALLLDLMGSVLGGWWASGEPMTLKRHRKTAS